MGSMRKSCEAASGMGKRILRQLGKRYIDNISGTAAANNIEHPHTTSYKHLSSVVAAGTGSLAIFKV